MRVSRGVDLKCVCERRRCSKLRIKLDLFIVYYVAFIYAERTMLP